jgi:hypothetical protein
MERVSSGRGFGRIMLQGRVRKRPKKNTTPPPKYFMFLQNAGLFMALENAIQYDGH